MKQRTDWDPHVTLDSRQQNRQSVGWFWHETLCVCVCVFVHFMVTTSLTREGWFCSLCNFVIPSSWGSTLPFLHPPLSSISPCCRPYSVKCSICFCLGHNRNYSEQRNGTHKKHTVHWHIAVHSTPTTRFLRFSSTPPYLFCLLRYRPDTP